MVNSLNGNQVRDLILENGYYATKVTAFYWGNFTEGLANTGKTVLTVQSGSRIGSSAYKAMTDFN